MYYLNICGSSSVYITACYRHVECSMTITTVLGRFIINDGHLQNIVIDVCSRNVYTKKNDYGLKMHLLYFIQTNEIARELF